jgi:hypothetical protein
MHDLEMFTTKEAMIYFNVTRDVIVYLKTKIPFIKKNNKIYYLKSDLESCLNPDFIPLVKKEVFNDPRDSMTEARLFEYQNKTVLNCRTCDLEGFTANRTIEDLNEIFLKFDLINLKN